MWLHPQPGILRGAALPGAFFEKNDVPGILDLIFVTLNVQSCKNRFVTIHGFEPIWIDLHWFPVTPLIFKDLSWLLLISINFN